MIHVIPHHIGKGSWINWYDLINFKSADEVTYYHISNPDIYEHNQLKREEYFSHLINHLKVINPKEGDSIFCDLQYFPFENHQIFFNSVNELSEKFKVKFFLVDTDNFLSYMDTENYTIFSNKFNINSSDVNFNYFRFRPSKQNYVKYIPELFTPFLENIRQKKFNFIVGVDKIERLLSLKHIYDSKILNDGYVAYSGFSRSYDVNSISESLNIFRNENIPIILDVPYDRSEIGAVNVEYPPLPITLNSYVSFICETSVIMDEIHLSEKSWNPFISLNIPLLLGSSLINTYLKNLGFWMADDIFDLSPKLNFIDIVTQYKSNIDIINNMSYSDLYDYFRQNKNAMIRNHELLINQKFIFDRKNYL